MRALKLIALIVMGCFGLLQAEQGIRHSNHTTLQVIEQQYKQFVFKGAALSFDAFSNAFTGFINLKQAGMLAENATLSIADFSRSSNQKRLWVLDMEHHKVLFHSLVAHGQGTGEEFAEAFSNIPESHQSSLGFYVTGAVYDGQHGMSLKLKGVDGKFNSNAEERAIVIHGADYVSDEFARANQRLGRSHGCPALPTELAPKVIQKIRDGHCLFIYAPKKDYLQASVWLRKKPDLMPYALTSDNTRIAVRYDDAEICEPLVASNNEVPEGVNVKRVVLSREEVERLGISKDKIKKSATHD